MVDVVGGCDIDDVDIVTGDKLLPVGLD